MTIYATSWGFKASSGAPSFQVRLPAAFEGAFESCVQNTEFAAKVNPLAGASSGPGGMPGRETAMNSRLPSPAA